MSAARSPGSNYSSRFFDIPLFRRPCWYRFRDIRHFACTFSLLKLFPLRDQPFAQKKHGNVSCFNRALIISVFGLLHKGITH